MQTLSGTRIAITGGATGIGFATARLAVERGATVVLVSRNEDRLRDAARSIGAPASHHVLDVRDADAVDRAFAEIGPINHLVTCASGTIAGPFAELAEHEVRSFFDVKFWGQYRAAKAALPHLASHGSIVLMSGFLFRKPQRELSPFAAADGAIEGLAKALAENTYLTGVTVDVDGGKR
jgi:NAD(P)-dependent dehydrogenase (short-subunit alcohol dehydrogenase family)